MRISSRDLLELPPENQYHETESNPLWSRGSGVEQNYYGADVLGISSDSSFSHFSCFINDHHFEVLNFRLYPCYPSPNAK